MANMVIDSIAFALADALETTIEARSTYPHLSAEIVRTVPVAGIDVLIRGKIVSHLLNRHNHMLLVRLNGNLILALCASDDAKHQTIVKLWVCNLVHMPAPEKWLETARPANAAALQKLLGKAVVRGFVRNGGSKWVAA